MANLVHLEKLSEGVEAWNRQQASEYPLLPPDFAGADLRGRDLSGANLVSANFSDANLQSARLGRGTSLRDANFQHANLNRADLTGADLQDAHFPEADLRDANFRETSLLGADLSEAVGGLRTEQYAGADLTGAELPKPLEELYESLENVKGISESARKIFLAMLAACLYCWLTIATTTDVNLITNRASSPLPIIQTPIPIVGFYVVAPLLVLCIYFYFHFYLQKLWEELGSLPAVFPDGRPLHAKVDPWLLNDLVRAHLPKLNVNRPFLSYFQLWISVLLAWWVVPITMFLFWGRYLRRHEWIGTTFHVALLVIALVAAVSLYRLAIATLRGAKTRPFTCKLSRRLRLTAALAALAVPIALGILLVSPNSRDYLLISYILLVAMGCLYWLVVAIVRLYQLAVGRLRGAERSPFTALTKGGCFAVVAGIGFGLISWGAIWGVRPDESARWWSMTEGEGTWVPRLMAGIGYPPFANLDGAEISQKKSTWNGKNPGDQDAVTGATLRGANLRYASAEGAFLAGADLDRAHLTGINLGRAQLSGARLDEADLGGANLSRANLRGTNLWAADLLHAILNAADLDSAILNAADLDSAILDFADLRDASLTRANLNYTHLDSADLTHSDFLGAKNLYPEQVKRARSETWKKAFYDCNIIEALGLPPDNNVKLFEELPKDQQDRYKSYGMLEPCPSPKQ